MGRRCRVRGAEVRVALLGGLRSEAALASDILDQLNTLADPANVQGMAHFAMSVDRRLGVPVPEMRRIAKAAGKDHAAALELWATGIAEARIVASMIAVPAQLTEEQTEAWVQDFDSWDVCDQVCMNLFEKSPLARRKIDEWSSREEEFVKRAAFALLACLAWHDKRATDEELIAFLSVIERGATDERNFVKKAVNWALRTIGKRNRRLNQAAIETAREIQGLDSKAARWIAADALRELESEKIQQRLI
jgi:3-methyladenine DNA glycosylase AlkD